MADQERSQDNEIEKDPAALGSIAEQSVKAAIVRGRKRRGRAHGVANNSDIHITPSQTNPSSLIESNQIPYHKRRRTALIPNSDEESEDSNDEWEEHVEVDRDLAVAREHEHQRGVLNKPNKMSGSSSEMEDDDNISSDDRIKRQPKTRSSPVIDEKTRARMRRQLMAQARKKVVRIHSIHASILISLLLRHDSVAQDNEVVRAFALSTAPVELFNDEIPFNEKVSIFALWTRTAFHPNVCTIIFDGARQIAPPVRRCSPVERAVNMVSQDSGVGDIFDVVTVAAAIARSCNIRCRVVSALQLAPHKLKPQAVQKGPLDEDDRSVKRNQPAILDSNTTSIMYAWLEVWCDDKWRAVDVFDGSVCMGEAADTIRKCAERIPEYVASSKGGEGMQSKPEDKKPTEQSKSTASRRRTRQAAAEEKEKEKERGRDWESMKPVDEMRRRRTLPTNFFAHVVAVENGLITDVSRRYSTAWSEIEKMRASGKHFLKAIEALGRIADGTDEIESNRLEQEEFEQRAALESVPKTLTAVQKHPRYVLERHVKKYEVIHPQEPIFGYINEEPVFLRANVRLLHTKDRWIRQMREVVNDAEPLKSVRSKNGTDATVDLFGEWQTKPLYIAPVAEDGSVPRGEHGNVDLWTADHMPAGGAHVNLKMAKQAARRLGVDFAPAMTGFELRRRRSVPRIEGVVVAKQFEDAVREAALELEAAAIQRAEERARAEEAKQLEQERRAREAEETVRRKYGGGGVEKADDSRTKRGNSKRAKSSEATEAGHVHEFGKEQHVRGDKWTKKCKGCGMEVTFEKL